MRKLPDYHLHTNCTEDGEATLEEHARAAAALGIPEIAVTDHYIAGLDKYEVSSAQVEKHFRDAESLRRRLGVEIRIGLEADFVADKLPQIEKFIKSFDFDYILGGAHFIDGCGVAAEQGALRLLERHDAPTCFRMSLESLETAIRSGLFDVMAHLDVIRKFIEKHAGPVPFAEYSEHAARVADALAETGAGFEINCRGFDHHIHCQYPGTEFLRLLAEKKIKIATIGSDAHSASLTGAHLGNGAAALKNAGFSHISVFRNRRPYIIPIAEFDIRPASYAAH